MMTFCIGVKGRREYISLDPSLCHFEVAGRKHMASSWWLTLGCGPLSQRPKPFSQPPLLCTQGVALLSEKLLLDACYAETWN